VENTVNKIYATIAGILITLTFILSSGIGQAHAATGASFSMRPTHGNPGDTNSMYYFVINGSAGDVVSNSLHVFNAGGSYGQATLKPTDATTMQYGGIAFPTTTPVAVGTWISPLPSVVSLNAVSSTDIPFTVSIPSDATAGLHMGGVVLQPVVPSSNGVLKTVGQMAIPVMVNVSGPLNNSLVSNGKASYSVNGTYTSVGLPILNAGNTLLHPSITATVYDHNGVAVTNITRNILAMLPGSSMTYPVSLNAPSGTYKIDATLTYEGGNVLHLFKCFTV